MGLEYGFCRQGGFYVLDHGARRAAYAYPTSTHAELAKRSQTRAVKAMERSLHCNVSALIAEDHYLRVAAKAVASV